MAAWAGAYDWEDAFNRFSNKREGGILWQK